MKNLNEAAIEIANKQITIDEVYMVFSRMTDAEKRAYCKANRVKTARTIADTKRNFVAKLRNAVGVFSL